MNDFGIWNPINPEEAYDLFRQLEIPWWIAGGWAIDLFIGRQTRQHKDFVAYYVKNDKISAVAIVGNTMQMLACAQLMQENDMLTPDQLRKGSVDMAKLLSNH